MESVLRTIKANNLFKRGEVLGVATSGGKDSIALLHFLSRERDNLDVEIVAIHVDHQIRNTSSEDALFVKRFCANEGIRCFVFKVDAKVVAQNKKIGIEEAAREVRYEVFENVLAKGIADKIVLAHHQLDQAETILLNLFRGSGLAGVVGMEIIRGKYYRPMLNTSRNEILGYLYENRLQHVDDETNEDNKYQRNFIRNRVMPLICEQWRDVDKTLVSFSQILKEDNDYLNTLAQTDGIIYNENLARIPINYLAFAPSLSSRTIRKALERLNLNKDIEKKHIVLIRDLKDAANGTKIDLPNKIRAIKEYEYITIFKPEEKAPKANDFKFRLGRTKIPGFGEILVKKISSFVAGGKAQFIDVSKLPKKAVWRTRKEGDEITKFGGGTKSLKSYLVEKKVPQRLRDILPVLAEGNQIYAVATVDISDKVKVGVETTAAYAIEYFLD